MFAVSEPKAEHPDQHDDRDHQQDRQKMCKREVSELHLVAFPEEIRKKLFHFFLPRVVGFIIPSFLRFHKDCMKNAAVPPDKKQAPLFGKPVK
jgi:hypothetical protein